MSNSDEHFDLTPQIDEPMNTFKIVHLLNRSDTYHLTRQVLLDSTLTQNTYCFFYHILAKNIDEFNDLYGSFACLIPRNPIEADLYLNVDSKALENIVKYIQTGKIDGEGIYAKNWKIIDEIVDLATMFGMPNLVTMLRNLHPSTEHINETFSLIKNFVTVVFTLYKKYANSDYDVDKYNKIFEQFLEDNRQNIIDTFIKNNIYNKSAFWFNCIHLYFILFVSPILEKYLVETKEDEEFEKHVRQEMQQIFCNDNLHSCPINSCPINSCPWIEDIKHGKIDPTSIEQKRKLVESMDRCPWIKENKENKLKEMLMNGKHHSIEICSAERIQELIQQWKNDALNTFRDKSCDDNDSLDPLHPTEKN